jgi:succinate dehydrogenase hydrophobic anchor subunit
MSLFDRLTLLATGLVAIYLIWRFAQHRKVVQRNSEIFYIISFAVLLVAGLLLIAFTYAILGSPWVVVVAALIPVSLAIGLTGFVYPKYEKPYLIGMVIGFLALAITRFSGPPTVATLVLILVHSIAGLTIFFLPFSAIKQEKAPGGFAWVSVGGALIGLGGIALAFLKTGRQFLFFSQELVFTILAPLLLLMALAYAWGFMKLIKAEQSA